MCIFHYFHCSLLLAAVLSTPINAAFSSNSAKRTFSLSDRFRASCPADLSSISQFDPLLVSTTNDDDGDNEKDVWVAVFRSSNNLPSVLIKDDFMNAMRIATTVQTDGVTGSGNGFGNRNSNGNMSQSTQIDDGKLAGKIENSIGEKKDSSLSTTSVDSGSGVKVQTPVAVAKLSPSSDFENVYTLESMRCSLKKENTDDSCDGQSEHAEAISICIDELILNYLRNGNRFDKSIRTKATLVSGKLLSTRGFQDVEDLGCDMATHVSSLKESLNMYASRAVETVSMSPGARDRALQILSFLGREEIVEDSEDQNNDGENGGSSQQDYDPWANMGIL